ncbi:MAG: hypothetical protein K8I60_17615, partial [Anaerolineae bacterium]|nr:hypothetical protein [Anaerolineae bacterium]
PRWVESLFYLSPSACSSRSEAEQEHPLINSPLHCLDNGVQFKAQLTENIGALEFGLSAEQMERLNQAGTV